MNNVGEKYLPLGSVVLLKGAKKRVMITGFCCVTKEHEGQMFDYSGCLYPEGIISNEQTALFNHEQIANVYHLGLIDEEEKKFKEDLKLLLSKPLNNSFDAINNVLNNENSNI